MKTPEHNHAADYTPREVEAARRVLIELGQILGGYREAVVLVGGWVPDLRLPKAHPPHIGSIEAFLVMKSFALTNRDKPKDAYDIYFCLLNIPAGVSALADKLRPYLAAREVRDGLKRLAKKFRSPDDYGPQSVVTFLNPSDPEERAHISRDSYERVDLLLRLLKDKPFSKLRTCEACPHIELTAPERKSALPKRECLIPGGRTLLR